MAEFVNRGRVAAAKAIKLCPIHVAWGAGLLAWDTVSATVSIESSALVAEIGRRLVTNPRYVTPDADGDIRVHSGRYAISADPTNHLYVETTFEEEDSPGAEIREVAVFVHGETNPALPPGQLYFLPEDIVEPGDMTVLEHVPKIIHTAKNRQTFRFVISL